MAVEGGALAGAWLEEPRLSSGGCWHRFSLPAGPHQVRVLITEAPGSVSRRETLGLTRETGSP